MTKKKKHRKGGPIDKGTFTKCPTCGRLLDYGDYPFCPHGQTGSAYAQRVAPIVVFRKPDGTYSIPGTNWSPTPKGAERVELRTLREIRQVQREINATTEREYTEKLQGRESFYNQARAESRAELKARMKDMTPAGRRFAELAMARTDRILAQRRTEMPTAFFHVTEYDSSNRERQRDESTQWKGRDA